MTIEIEAGASRFQCSMKLLAVHAFSASHASQAWQERFRTDADLRQPKRLA